MVLTTRDADILRLVARYRFLRSHHLSSLLGGSRQQLLRRLQTLFHHGYLERPPSQVDYFLNGGSRAMVYGLGNRGAAYLHRTGAILVHRLDWSARNRSIRRLFLDHALMISDILVAIEMACRANPNVTFLYLHDLSSTERKRGQADPGQWTIQTPTFGEVGVVPDAAFVLRSACRKEILCLLEADRGTMPVVSRERHRSSLARKFAAYTAIWRSGKFRREFGFARVRVITVTTALERLHSITECLRKTRAASGLFAKVRFAQVIENPSGFLANILMEAPRDA